MTEIMRIFSFYFFVFITSLHAGWPDEGWIGFSSLNITHEGQTINFDELHRNLSEKEAQIASVLPGSDVKNIVLVSISFLIEGTPVLQTFPLLTPEEKHPAFESGWESSFMTFIEKANNPPPGEPINNKQADFNTSIAPSYHFFNERFSVETMLEKVMETLSQAGPEGRAVYDDALKNHAAVKRVTNQLRHFKQVGFDHVAQLITPESPSESYEELSRFGSQHAKSMKTYERSVNNIGSKAVSTYFHSEQKLLNYMEVNLESICENLRNKISGLNLTTMFINIHSRHDICDICSHSFVCAYTKPNGAFLKLKDALCKDSPLHITSSFRDFRTGKERSYAVSPQGLESLAGFGNIGPAFPTLHILPLAATSTDASSENPAAMPASSTTPAPYASAPTSSSSSSSSSSSLSLHPAGDGT